MIRLSKHVTDEMDGRGVLLGYIERTVEAPDRIVPNPVQTGLSRSYRAFDEFGGRVLRVVHRPDGHDTFVATAHGDAAERAWELRALDNLLGREGASAC